MIKLVSVSAVPHPARMSMLYLRPACSLETEAWAVLCYRSVTLCWGSNHKVGKKKEK